MNFRKFVKIWSTIVLGGTLFVLTVGIVVDPYDLYDVVSVRGFNAVKPRRGYSPLVRSLELCREKYDTVFLGSSRILAGIDPRSIWLEGGSAYNAGLYMANIDQIGTVVDYILRCNKPEKVIIGLDFYAFSANGTVGRKFSISGFAGPVAVETYLSRTMTTKAVGAALETVRVNFKQPETLDDLGFRDKSSRKINHREAFRNVLTNFMSKSWSYGGFTYNYEHIVRLRDFVARLVENDVQVFLFMSPIHVQQMNAIKQLDLYSDFEQWKRDVTRVIKEFNGADHSRRRVEIWDFSNFNSVTSEPVPAAGSKARMNWYYESSHYTQRTGDLILARLLHPEKASTVVPRDFGVDMNELEIETYLDEIRAALIVYEEKFPEDVEKISRLVAKTAPKRAALAQSSN